MCPADFHTTLTTTSTAGNTRGATEEEHWAQKAYNRSRGQSERPSASLPLIKKKTKQNTKGTHNVANLSAAPLTTNIARAEPLTRFKPHFPSL